MRKAPAAADLESYVVGAVQRRVRTRVLRIAVRHGALTPAVAAELARWGHGGGFSVHAAVRIEADDRAGLEHLLRYCARPGSRGTAPISRSATPCPGPCPTARPNSPSPRSNCSIASPR